MGTQALIDFGFLGDNASPEATIYIFQDGMPSIVLPNLEDFFVEVDRQTPGPQRFTNPGLLAAQFIVWWSVLATDTSSPLRRRFLNFHGIGVIHDHPGDIDFEYQVDCGSSWPDGHPRVAVVGVTEAEEVDMNRAMRACVYCAAILKPTGEAEISYCLGCGAAG